MGEKSFYSPPPKKRAGEQLPAGLFMLWIFIGDGFPCYGSSLSWIFLIRDLFHGLRRVFSRTNTGLMDHLPVPGIGRVNGDPSVLTAPLRSGNWIGALF